VQVIFQRKAWITTLMLAVCLLVARSAGAHHGWGWATDEEFEITGTIAKVSLGNPHGEVTLEVNGAQWRIEVGQPWRNRRAGLDTGLLIVGRLITVHGHRSAKKSELLVKAERVIIDGKSYNLYPDRQS
jgi:hypothetical protein